MSGEHPPERFEADTAGLPPVAGRETIATPMAGSMPEHIGHYHLKRLIGSGGMGSVYEAEQENPHRMVALKVMKQGVTSRSALRRFEYESEVLARLRHPGIAQVYEAGTHDDGSGGVPYFAMEYIQGARILTQYVQMENLGTEQRLELFLQICDAVHHGHQKGVIHRDLKPENILVDTAGHPKIIDFGIARATDSDLRAATIQTQVGELVGTVPYMSPEQCAADPHDIDTRSDVYALGIVCYELLTGQLPYDVTDVAIYEATRIIREELPTPLGPINSELKGDIETIVFKALEKDRVRRYQSAAEMAQDIRRFLDHEPILARPPSVYYQMRSFAKRNKALVAGAVAVLLALTVGFIGTTIGFVEARAAEADAVRKATTARAVTDYFKQMFEMLDAEQDGVGKEARVIDMLDVAAMDIDRTFENEPEVRAELKASIGTVYRVLTEFSEAEPQLRAAVATVEELEEPNLELLADSLHGLSSVIYGQKGDKAAEAEELCRRALRLRLELYGDGHEKVAESYNQLAACENIQYKFADAERHYKTSLSIRQELMNRDQRLEAARAAGTLEPMQKTMLRKKAASHNNLATCLMSQDKIAEAKINYRQAIALLDELYGDTPNFKLAITLSNLARLQSRDGEPDVAEANFRRALAIKLNTYADDHGSVAVTRRHLAELLLDTGRNLTEAEALARRVVEVRRNLYEPDDARIGMSTELLGRILMARGDTEEARPLFEEALPILEPRAANNDDLHAATIRTLEALATIAEGAGDATQAEAYRRRMETVPQS